MANTDAPFGFKAIRHRAGGEIRLTKYIIASDESGDLFVGDPVIKNGSASTTGDNAGIPIVTKATAGTGNAITGIIGAIGPVRSNLSLNYYDASAISEEVEVYVYDDPYTIFIAQDDGAGTALAVTEIGLNINAIFTHTGDTTTGVSQAELDGDSSGSGATLQFKLLRLHKDGPGDNVVGANAIWEVTINNHTEGTNIAGV